MSPLASAARRLRRQATPAERHLWQFLRARRLGHVFRRQFPIDRFVVDFLCRRPRLVVEVDGEYHQEQVVADCERTALLEARGYTVIRFTNAEVTSDTPLVLRTIRKHLQHLSTPLLAKKRGRGRCPLQPRRAALEKP